MRLYVSVLIVFLVLTGIAFGAVGDAGVSDGISSVQPGQTGQTYLAGTGTGMSGMASSPTSYQSPQMGSSQSFQAPDLSSVPGYQTQNKQATGYQPSSLASQTYASVAPQTGGPYEERMSADDLRLSQPEAESFQPDSNLNFAPATPPSVSEETYGAVQGTGQGASRDAGQETGSWYYPGSVTSRNKFKVQTFSGLKTIAGCSYGGYLPLWADINSAGNFYVYEWYPGQWTPSVRWWGWTWPGFKKGWFTGDVPGWHILSYNCRDWSNYVYIYVWPSGSGSGAYGSGYSTGHSTGYSTGTPTPAATASEPLPTGAPTPPDPNAENLVLPDFNLLQPSTGQSGYAAGTASMTGTAGYSPQYSSQYPSQYQSQGTTNFPIQGANAIYPASYTPQVGYTQGYTQGSYPSSYPAGYSASQTVPGSQAQKVCTACADQGSPTGQAAPSGYVAQTYQTVKTYQTVFPKPSTCKCNEYYVQVWPNKLSTVGSVKCGEWLPLWSKISKPGIYWSFEWTQCGSPAGYYC
ncbi:MAG TPA: hypothetical protein VLB04_07955 [Methanotrichaceae archaeon]|nr:hypothetical protein [Methanotrichaceae archaeon]